MKYVGEALGVFGGIMGTVALSLEANWHGAFWAFLSAFWALCSFLNRRLAARA